LVQSNYISYGLARLEKQYLELNPKWELLGSNLIGSFGQ
jgi:hypothetical protein